MARRVEAPDSLDFFPTPPWATRALCELVLPLRVCDTCWEPAAGEGHMAEVLREWFADIRASDVHDYGRGYEVGSFVGSGIDVAPAMPVDWIITNPPFNLARQFAERAISEAQRGVALLVRTAWLEGAERYRNLFAEHRPSFVALFSERVPMVKGRWDPSASTATSYCWVVWNTAPELQPRGLGAHHTNLMWLPPGCRQKYTAPNDVARFA